MITKKEWLDNRSGTEGQEIGNTVLTALEEQLGEDISHEKGTVFTSPSYVIVGRICATIKYLQNNVLHFSNMSAAQVAGMNEFRKKILYLFISANEINIHYWLVPGKIIERVISKLVPKPSANSSFLRIINRNGQHCLAGQNITKYHTAIPKSKSENTEVIPLPVVDISFTDTEAPDEVLCS